MPALVQDLRLATRALLGRPGYSLAALLTLALGLGATTAVFSALHGYLRRELPLPAGDRVVRVFARIPQFGDMKLGISAADYLDVRERAPSLAAIGIYDPGRARLGQGQGAARIAVVRLTPSLLEVLRVGPQLGRGFSAQEGVPGRDAVALLAHATWVDRFASDPRVLGRRLHLDGRAVEIVGVMPPRFVLPQAAEAELLLPLPIDPGIRGGNERGNWDGITLARLAVDASPEAAETELRALWQQLARENPSMAFTQSLGYRVAVETLRDSEVAALRPVLRLLQVAALLVLLVAAANLAGLTLSRLAARGRELAVRSALGAGTRRLLRLVLIENLVLAAAGGAVGVLLARLALPVIEARGLAPQTTLVTMRPDGTVLALGMGLALLTGALASLAPVWWLRRTALAGVLRGHGRGTTGGQGAQRLRGALVVGQVAVSLALAVLVGLLAVSLQRLLAVDTGFESEGVLFGQLGPRDEIAGERRRLDRTALLAGIAALPGTAAVGLTSCLPFAGCAEVSSFRIAGLTGAPGAPEPTAKHAQVSPGYFAALRMPLLAGRGFTPADLGEDAAVVVDRAFAQQWFPGRSPLGQRLELAARSDGTPREPLIVGVVGNVRTQDLASGEPEPTFYTTGREHADGAYLVARVAAATGAASRLADEVARLEPGSSLGATIWLRDRIRATLAPRVAPMLLVGAFAALATALAALGVYAVLALAVARRRAELGVRAALGADRGRLLRLVLRQGAVLLGTGLALGVLLALAASALVASLLFGVGRADPLVYAAAIAALAAIGLVACAIPAARAAAVEPTLALRPE